MRESNANKYLHKDTPNLLKNQIEECFNHEKGPGSLPPKNNKLIPGMIVPHDAYELAGPAMAWSYFSLPKADVYVIIGMNHSSKKTCLTQETTNTPFGMIRVDQSIARELLTKKHIKEDNTPFKTDKKIDVQLPFIQYLNEEKLEKIKILPLLLGNDVNIEELSTDIKEILTEQNKTAVFICVTNFTHYGTKFKYAPYPEEIRKNIYAIDKNIIELIQSNELDKLQGYLEENLIPMWGLPTIKLLNNLIRPKHIHLQQYYTSGDINNVDNPSIAYASLILE